MRFEFLDKIIPKKGVPILDTFAEAESYEKGVPIFLTFQLKFHGIL